MGKLTEFRKHENRKSHIYNQIYLLSILILSELLGIETTEFILL